MYLEMFSFGFSDELVEPEWLLSIPEDLFYNCDEASGETGMDMSSAEGTERGSMLVSDSEEDELVKEEGAWAGLRTEQEVKTAVIYTLMEAAEGDVLDKRGGIFRTEEMKMQTIEMFGLEGNIEYESFMRIVLKMQSRFRRKIEWRKGVLQTLMAQIEDEVEPEAPKPFPPLHLK